jgi:hypothetical protein
LKAAASATMAAATSDTAMAPVSGANHCMGANKQGSGSRSSQRGWSDLCMTAAAALATMAAATSETAMVPSERRKPLHAKSRAVAAEATAIV